MPGASSQQHGGRYSMQEELHRLRLLAPALSQPMMNASDVTEAQLNGKPLRLHLASCCLTTSQLPGIAAAAAAAELLLASVICLPCIEHRWRDLLLTINIPGGMLLLLP